MSIVTDTPRDWIKPLSILCPGDLNFDFHIEDCELSRGEPGLEREERCQTQEGDTCFVGSEVL